MQGSSRDMRSPTSPLEQQPTTINLYQGLGFLPEFSTTKQMADEFTNQLFHRLEGCCGMMRSRTTPYHPKGMGKKREAQPDTSIHVTHLARKPQISMEGQS